MKTEVVLTLGYSLIFYIGVTICLALALGYCLGTWNTERKQNGERAEERDADDRMSDLRGDV